MSERDPERTRRAILDAAIGEFVAHGPAGARIDAIARVAQVNKRMLYHYFGSKAGLFAAVRADRLDRGLPTPVAAGTDELVARYRASRTRSDEVRLSMWEALAGSEPASDDARAAVWRRRVESLARAQREGRLSRDVEPELLELAATALAWFPLAFAPLTRLITDRDCSDPRFVAGWERLLERIATQFTGSAPLASEPAVGAKPRYRLTAVTVARS